MFSFHSVGAARRGLQEYEFDCATQILAFVGGPVLFPAGLALLDRAEKLREAVPSLCIRESVIAQLPTPRTKQGEE